MADIVDKAQQLEDLQRKVALAGITFYEGEPANYCIKCDSKIPTQRRRLLPGVQTCIYCAQDLEHRNKRYHWSISMYTN